MQDERQINVSLTDVGRNIRQELPCISEKIASEMDLSLAQYEQIKLLLQGFIKKELQ